MTNRQKSRSGIQVICACASVLLGICASASVAQNFPVRPIRYIMPLPAGSETDAFGRILAQQLADNWGQQVIVDNRPGGGTVIGTEVAAKASADGYTLLHALTAHAINPTLRAKLPYDTVKDFACITWIGDLYGVLIAHPSVPVQSVGALIALAKAQPGKLVYATGPVGNSSHINTEALRVVAGIDIAPIHYKGGALAMQDLIPGRVPLVATVVIEALPFIRSGKARPIAITSPKRSPSLPGVPTVGEGLSAYQPGSSFWVLLARAGTPTAAITQLNAAVIKAMRTTSLRERMAQMDVEPIGSTPEQCDAFLQEQVKLWGGIVRASGARAE